MENSLEFGQEFSISMKKKMKKMAWMAEEKNGGETCTRRAKKKNSLEFRQEMKVYARDRNSEELLLLRAFDKIPPFLILCSC
jgi:hypothetical protein